MGIAIGALTMETGGFKAIALAQGMPYRIEIALLFEINW
jgi:hypothetical protein